MELTYDGKYPILCGGRLIVKVGETTYDFGTNVLVSGGGCYHDHCEENGEEDWWSSRGPWEIHRWPEEFPVELREELLELVNKQIEQGCCGGCL